ncbi:MAG: MBL fold metallo-hydrolase [Candidatus Latescibacteria bacterium]|nr:MBL fold metallo-hydrolase [Candidatus Latescibacterota bacterium]
MEVLEGLHRIETRLGNRKLFQHLFVGDRVIVIDTGVRETPETDLFPYLETIGKRPSDIDLVIISHADADHFGGNETIRKAAPAAWLAAHAFDVPWVSNPDRIVEERYNQFAKAHGIAYSPEVRQMLRDMMGGPVPIDLQLKGGETILLDEYRPLHILFLPGHTRGHIGVYDPVHKAAVLTDAILWRGLQDVQGQIVMPPTYCYTETYRATIRFVESLDIHSLFLSHYAVITGREDIGDFIAETQRFVDRTDAAILDVLRQSHGWKTLEEMIDAVDPLVGPFGDARLELAYPLLGHLNEFVRQGRLEESASDELTCWRFRG